MSRLLLALALLLTACSPVSQSPPGALITRAEAIEFDAAPPVARKYRPTMTREARAVWGLDAPIPMLAAQIHQESAWNEGARSPVGAGGLAQFMPSTATDFPDELGRVDVYNPDWAIRAQARYMRDLYGRVSYPRECDRMGASLSAYNGGIGWHNKRQRIAVDRGDPTNFWNSVRTFNPGVTAANQRENEEYPVRIVDQRQGQYRTWGRVVCPERGFA